MHRPDTMPQHNNKARVLLAITRLTTGGDTNVVLDMAGHFCDHPEFEASLVVGPVPEGETDLTHLAYERGIPTIMVPDLVNRIDPPRNLAALRQIRSLIVWGRYDIVHTHSSMAGVVGRMAAASARTPVIVHHVHGWGVQEGMSRSTKSVYLALERLCARFTSRLIAVSGPTIEKGIELGIGRRDKFALIYNGIQLEKFSRPADRDRVLPELGLDPGCKTVGMIGRLDVQKNPLDFIRAAALVARDYPKVQFIIAGDGCLRRDCERLILELGLAGRFALLGFRNDIDRILPALDVVAMSSLWEGLPLVFQEAMSAGKPVVANNVDGVSDVVIDGETGYLTTPHRPDEMARRILHLLNNGNLRRRMGATAQERSTAFSSERMIESIESLYRELLAARTDRGRQRGYPSPAVGKRPA